MDPNAFGVCTLCDTPLRRAEMAEHVATSHGSRNHVGADISRKLGDYFRENLPTPKPKNIRVSAEEHAAVRRLNAVHKKAHKVEKSGQLDDWAFTYGFFVGTGIEPKRAHEFTLLYCYHEWGTDPLFEKALP